MRYRGVMDTAGRPLSGTEAAAAEELLRDAPLAYLAMIDTHGPYVVPLNFAYVAGEAAVKGGASPGPASPALDGCIYFHTGEGRKTAALATDPRVCLAVTAGTAFHQGDSPCADGFWYRSLLVWGRARRMEDRRRREQALRAIVAKYDAAAARKPFGEADFAQTLLYEVSIETVAYKERSPAPTG
jgi:nitroimidazol reductase NimA-like FMN-containing flavoprotein (pyridoxamine 5'-phosphate oxidase superfamily)